MTTLSISSASRSAIIDAVSAERTSTRQWVKVTDNLQADGIKASMIATEKHGGNPELREQVRGVVMLGFTKAEQALLASESKTLSDVDKATKRHTQQQVGSMLGHIERLLAKAESKADNAPKPPTTKWSRFQDQLDKMVSAVQDNEGATGLDAPAALKALKLVKAYMPKV